MNTRRRFEPLAPVSSNIVAAPYAPAAAKAGAPHDDHYNAMDAQVQDENTANSGTGSGMSGLSSLEDDTTDDFGKLLLQHARDEQRMQDALQGKVRPFSRARPKQRSRLTLENLERNGAQVDSGVQRQAQFSSPVGSMSSGERSDPPLNVPRQWGRKAKRGSDWLRRGSIRAEEEEARSSEEEVILHRKTSYTGDGTPHSIDWVSAAADVPLPTTEGSPSPFRYARGTPPSIQKRDDSLQRIHQWNIDDDFSSNSILTSTPAVVSRNTRLDEIRLRELETVTERSFESRSRDQSPEPSHRRNSSSFRANSAVQKPDEKSPEVSWAHPAEQNIALPKRGSSSHSRSRSIIAIDTIETNESSSSPVVVYKESDAAAQSITPRRLQQHKRSDSHDLLRRLARAASNSPSPARPATENTSEPRPANTTSSAKDLPGENEPAKTGASLRSSKTDAKIATAKSEEGLNHPPEDEVDPHTPFPDELGDTSNVHQKHKAKTPVVTGAWVDTPAPTTGKRVSSSPSKLRPLGSKRNDGVSATSPPKQTFLTISPSKSHLRHGLPTPETSESPEPQPRKPSLPSSALAAVLDDAKSNQKTSDSSVADPVDPRTRDFAVGDSTINSLQDLVDSSITFDANAPQHDDTDTLRDHLPALPAPGTRPKSAAERQRWKEIEQVSRMNQQLRAARSNIRDARVGLRRMEHAVLTLDEKSHRGGEGCDVCGCPGGSSSFRHLVTETRSMFVTKADTEIATDEKTWWPWRRKWQLTTFGLLAAILITYILTEYTLCKQFCHPRYAARMTGYGVNPNAPRLPFVIPTLLFRPLRWLWHPAWASFKQNGVLALRAAGLLEEAVKKERPWMERRVWESIVEAAKETATATATATTKRWMSSVVESVKPTATMGKWVEGMAGRVDDGWSMLQDEVI